MSYPNDLKTSLLETEWTGQGIYGFLIGRVVDARLHLLNVWKCKVVNTNRLYDVLHECHSHLSGGVDVKGVIVVLQSCIVTPEIIDVELEKLPQEVQNTLPKESFVVCLLELPQQSHRANRMTFYKQQSNGKRTIMAERNDLADVTKDHIIFRIRAQIPLELRLDNSKPEDTETWHEKINRVISNSDLSFASGNYSYGICDTDVYLRECSVSGPKNIHTCEDLCRHLDEIQGVTSSRKKRISSDHPPVQVDMYQQISGHSDRFTQPTCAPAVHHKAGSFRALDLQLPLDVVVEAAPTEELVSLSKVFTEAVRAQLHSMKQCLHQYSQESLFHIPEAFHFQIPQRHSRITVIYPRGVSEKDLERQRRSLHQQMCLPLVQPLFRRANAQVFPGQTALGGHIINAHEGLPPSAVKGGTAHIVKGYYTYHHYMQDHFDDDKWGCAYRSLQTLVSWFKLQGYTDRSIPSHREIQQVLVDIGDKDQKFVGSKKWIGSFEVSYCLDNLLGVTSKFLSVPNGAEMATKGRELAQHFDTQGTPIMIGGGVLAHTILGVDYNELTGDISFLILDPHYTGGEDLQVIQKEGWCGWKPASFWVPTALYNMCMPQRPNLF